MSAEPEQGGSWMTTAREAIRRGYAQEVAVLWRLEIDRMLGAVFGLLFSFGEFASWAWADASASAITVWGWRAGLAVVAALCWLWGLGAHLELRSIDRAARRRR